MGVKYEYMKKVRKKGGKDEHDLFHLRYPIASSKEAICQAEVDGLVEWAKTILVGKSGSPYMRNTYSVSPR